MNIKCTDDLIDLNSEAKAGDMFAIDPEGDYYLIVTDDFNNFQIVDLSTFDLWDFDTFIDTHNFFTDKENSKYLGAYRVINPFKEI